MVKGEIFKLNITKGINLKRFYNENNKVKFFAEVFSLESQDVVRQQIDVNTLEDYELYEFYNDMGKITVQTIQIENRYEEFKKILLG